MSPNFDLEKIKFATDSRTFERAVKLYENRKVIKFRGDSDGFHATVLGGDTYDVYVSSKRFDEGFCDCYLGEQDTLCKHMVAVAIYAVKSGKELSVDDKEQYNQIIFSEKLGELTNDEIFETKKSITESIQFIKAYRGPSRTWFAYQDSLQEGCNRLSYIVSKLPVSIPTAKLLIDLALRLDRKLCRGRVDDSDGTVGGFIEELVYLLKEYAKVDPKCIKEFKKLESQSTCFDWEEPLLEIYKNNNTI